MIILPPAIVVAVILVISSIIHVVILLKAWKLIEFRRILILIISGALATYFGVLVLKYLDTASLKIFMGVSISIFSVMLTIGIKRQVKHEKLLSIPVGMLSGILNSSIGMCGPPVILFFTNQGIKKTVFRANVVFIFLIFNILTLTLFWFNGLLNPEVITCTIQSAPGMIFGSILGISLTGKIPELIFKRIGLALVFLAGVISIANGFGVGK